MEHWNAPFTTVNARDAAEHPLVRVCLGQQPASALTGPKAGPSPLRVGTCDASQILNHNHNPA
jgi:hypothetical protein